MKANHNVRDTITDTLLIRVHIAGDISDLEQIVPSVTKKWTDIVFDNSPKTGKKYKVTALLTIDDEHAYDEQILKL